MASTASSDHAGVFVPPPFIYIAFFLAGIGLQRYVHLPRLPITIGRLLSAVLIGSGLTLIAWSFRRFWASGTSVVPVRPTTALVIEGPYKFTRNPMYVALLLLYGAAALWFGLVWPILLAPVLVWAITAYVIGHEERYLIRKFGDHYHRYCATVRRWL